MELRELALEAFLLADPASKSLAVTRLWQRRGQITLSSKQILQSTSPPGRPQKPHLVDPKSVPRRSPYTAHGHAALMHSVVHIEFNAISLALDAVWRFDGMPDDFYLDWLQVAYEEVLHFNMLLEHLQRQGFSYGDFDAHDGLWTMCERTSASVCERMALVPRTLEARGLDATPVIQEKLRKVATPCALEAAHLLDTILRDEVGHVATGNRWYNWLCQRDGLDAQTFYEGVAKRHNAPKLRPPLNVHARQQAGFSVFELASFTELNKGLSEDLQKEEHP